MTTNEVEEEYEVHKSEQMERVCEEHGWEAISNTDMSEFEISNNANDILWFLYASRERESLKVEWRGDVQIKATHKDHRGKVTNPAWRGAVMKIIEARPHVLQVPFNIEDDSAYDIMLALYRKKITFKRTIDGAEDQAYVDVNLKEAASAKHFKLKTTSTGRRVIEWADTHGFHAIGLDQIIGVE